MKHDRDMEAARLALTRWLSERRPNMRDLELSPIRTPGGTGVANETLLADARWREDGVDRLGGFAVRLAARDPFWIDADIKTQFLMYQALADEPDIPVPPVIAYEADPAWLGAPFYVMEKIEGVVPPDLPFYSQGGFVFEATPADRRLMWEEAVAALAKVHKADVGRLTFLDRPHLGEGGFRQELNYFRRYLDWAAHGRVFETLELGWEWLNANLPTDSQTGLSWGDARVGNMIFKDFRVQAVLDWDTVSLAGPETDIAWWLHMERDAPQALDGWGQPDELVALWEDLTGWKVRNLHYHRVFTAFRLGAIALKVSERMVRHGILSQEAADERARVMSGEKLTILLGL